MLEDEDEGLPPAPPPLPACSTGRSGPTICYGAGFTVAAYMLLCCRLPECAPVSFSQLR